MATRYYPTKRWLTVRFRGPLDGDWNEGDLSPYMPDFEQYLLSTTKANGGQIGFFNNKCNQQPDYNFPLVRMVTAPLEAQTISGTIDLCFSVWARYYDSAFTVPASVRYKIHVYISTGDDPTPRAVLLDNYVDSVDWPPLISNAWTSLASPQSLATEDIVAGDRIVIEFGASIIATPEPTPNYPPDHYTEFPVRNLGTTNSSNVPWPDAVAGDTDANEVGWFDFSDTITEQAAPAAPANDACDDAINIVAFPYQSADIVTVSSTDTDRGVWWKFTAPSTGIVIIDTLGTNYRCEILVYTGADCASKVGATPIVDISYALMSQTVAWVEVTEGEQYFINIQVAYNNSIGAINSGGVCRIAVNYQVSDLVNDDIYIPVGDRIFVYRDGVIVKIRATGGSVTTGCYFDYSELPIDSLNGGVDTKIRFCFGLFGFDLVEIIDADTLNWDELEVDYLDEWHLPGGPGTGVSTLFITPEGLVYIAQWGNGYLYVAGSGTLPAILNTVSDDPTLVIIVALGVDKGANQPGYPFPYDSYGPSPEITSPWAITFDQDAGILYYNSGGFYVPVGGQSIGRFDITNDNQLSDFVTLSSSGGQNPGLKGICRLTNGTFLVCNGLEVKLLAANGTIIRTFTPSISMDSQDLVDVRATTDENFFWVMDGASSHMFKFRIADGIEVDDILVFGGPGNFTQFAIYGIPEPPPPFNPLSGIYKVVPGKRNDTLWESFDPEETEDVKIPDPFIKSALFGK